jgi:hypothetical protein
MPRPRFQFRLASLLIFTAFVAWACWMGKDSKARAFFEPVLLALNFAGLLGVAWSYLDWRCRRKS